MSAKSKITVEELTKFWPLKKISDEGLAILSERVKIAVLPEGKALISHGKSLSARFYLLKGTVKLKSIYGHTKTVHEDDNEATKPIEKILPELDTATSATNVKLMAITPSDFDELSRDYPRIKDRKLPEQLAHLAALMAGENPLIKEINDILDDEEREFPLPKISDVTFKVLKACVEPDVEARTIGEIIDEDDRISRRIIQIANSPAFVGSKRAFSCFEAVARLGIKTSSSIVVSFSLRQLYECNDFKINKIVNEMWNRSIQVAADAFIIAKHSENVYVDAEDALLAGLIHEIGAIPVCHFADEHKELMWKAKELESAIKALKARFGGMIMDAWGLGQEFAIVTEEVENPHREDDDPDLDLCDVVQIARFLNAPKSDPYSPQQLFLDLSSVQKMGINNLTKSNTLTVIEENFEEKQAVCEALRS